MNEEGMTHEEFLEWSAKEHGWSIQKEVEWQAYKEWQYQAAKAKIDIKNT